MPRKSAKKETAPAEAKTEGATRRSGRSVTKQEPAPTKEASRSRRSSTAAQTAASVADSKSPKGRSSSPAESRQKTRRESSEPRVKSARRAASRVNYKESDGEEESLDKKIDENFDSNEEFEESDSDEKSKPKLKGKVAKTPTKGRGTKAKGRSSRSRRGRPSKKHSSDEEDDEEMEPIELSDDSAGDGEEKKPKESARPSRGRKAKADATPESEEKPKSRRSARAKDPVAREESPRKRPTRGVQAKKYTEDDDEIEEVDQEEAATDESGRKRKRSSTSDSNKRHKSEESEEQKEEAGSDEQMDEAKAETEKAAEDAESKSEPMDVDESEKEKEEGSKAESGENKENEGETSEALESKEAAAGQEQEVSKSGEDSKPSLDSESAKKADHPASSEAKPPDSGTEKQKDVSDSKPHGENSVAEADDDSKESEEAAPAVANSEQKTPANQGASDSVSKNESPAEKVPNDINSVADKGMVPGVITHSKETGSEAFNGADGVSESTPAAAATPGKMHVEESVPTANGAHEPHTNSTSESDQYYPLPGRKYIANAKLSPSIRQVVKDKTFGFVSYNLSDSSIQKEKLLNELNKLEAHIICLQEVSKSFYVSVLEPSLDALGFKGAFSQPEDQENGVATFYKTSIFRLSGQSTTSLKQLIEKELEASSLEPSDKLAVKSHIQKCGHVFFTHFATVIGTHSLTVANVQVPPTDLSIHALEVSCLAREVVRVNSGTSKPFLLGGEFNMLESEAPYQLMRDGYLSNEMIEELMRRKDVVIPGKENAALVNLLWNSFQHPSSTLCSCYKSILDHEVFSSEQKTTSPDLLWYSSDSLYTTGVVNTPETGAVGRHVSLKAELAFSC